MGKVTINQPAMEKLLGADVAVRSASVSTVVQRACRSLTKNGGVCRTPNPLQEWQDPWSECPHCGAAAIIEDYGLVSYMHRNPIINWYVNFKIRWRERLDGRRPWPWQRRSQ